MEFLELIKHRGADRPALPAARRPGLRRRLSMRRGRRARSLLVAAASRAGAGVGADAPRAAPAAPAAPAQPALTTEPAMLHCPSVLGEGVADEAHVLRRADRPRSGRRHHHHAAAAHRPGDADLRPAQPAHLLRGAGRRRTARYRRYTATIGVLTAGQHAAVAGGRAERVPDARPTCVDRVGGGAGPGGVKAVAPTGVEPIIDRRFPPTEKQRQHPRREAAR